MPLSWPKPLCNGTHKKEEKQKSSQDKEESSLVTAKTTADDGMFSNCHTSCYDTPQVTLFFSKSTE